MVILEKRPVKGFTIMDKQNLPFKLINLISDQVRKFKLNGYKAYTRKASFNFQIRKPLFLEISNHPNYAIRI